ncbi:MAG: restriction endonuclease [Oscillibacter sp.]|nr:restriction endonuclease [Oscillibacter sp.]
MWGIHTWNDDLFLQESVIAIGWPEMGSLSEIEPSREAFKEAYAEAYPDAAKGNVAVSAGMLFRFVYEMELGDYVVFPSKSDQMVNIGEVTGEYKYVEEDEEYPHRRKIKWLKHLPRTAFPQGALYEIGSLMTLFTVRNYADEFFSALTGGGGTLATDVEAIHKSTKDFIRKELSRQFKGYDLEDFVANLLETMGYRTTISPHGGDRGRDIIAYKDELPPRILVQVKSQDGDIPETMVQALKGAMRQGDYGLFVALSDYTKNAQRYLEENPIIRGINGVELAELILKYYDKIHEKYRKMIPLEQVYIPVARDTDE